MDDKPLRPHDWAPVQSHLPDPLTTVISRILLARPGLPLWALVVVLWALTFAGVACSPSAPEQSSLSEGDLIAIRALAAAHLEAVINRNADSVAALYTEDAVQMPPNRPIVEGREGIHAALAAGPETFMDRVSFWGVTPSQEGYEGGLVYNWGTYWLTVSRPGSTEQVPYAGKYLVLLRKHATGSWSIAREIWTADQPSPR